MICKVFCLILILIGVLNLIHGQYTTGILAGTGIQGWTGDNGPATSANLNFVASCFVDSNSNTFLVDYSANVVRKVNPAGIITTIGGTGSSGIANAGGAFTSVQLFSPWGVNGDSNYLYISDNYHVWKYNRATGIVAILAGTGTQGTAGNGGPATSAQINKANGLWLTTDGILYIAEFGNNLVRKITTANIISTVVGGGGAGRAGDGGPAASTNVKLNAPQGVYMDTNGVLFFADRNNGRIGYVVNGIVNTYAGGGPSGNTADGLVGTNAWFSSPFDVKGDSIGNIYAVEGSNKVKVVDYSTKAVTTYLSTGLSAPRGMWLGIGTTNTACVGMLAYVKTAPLYVNPTPANPTASPTLIPTMTPTDSPSLNPTISPTVIPTANPSFTPSAVPTASPTRAPTTIPTVTPSVVPTMTPTNAPSKAPTAAPSTVPTASPTAQPTTSPTFTPSAIPTTVPTAVPTTNPTHFPSAFPTAAPTPFPTNAPTAIPSAVPTASPSVIPTVEPTFTPTAVPTLAPSHFPTSAPSSIPSSLPTSIPSSLPSSSPTSFPTAPTFMPTAAPSFSPTAVNPDVVKVDATTRVKFVDGTNLNDVSLATLITAFQNISDNPQSTIIVSTTLVSQSSSSIKNNNMKARALLDIQGSFTYDIRFRNTYVMALHPGYNSSQLASLKVARIQQQIELGSFETTLRNLAVTNNATQLLNSTCNEVTEIGAVVVPPSSGSSSSSDGYSTGVVIGIVIGVVAGVMLLSLSIYLAFKSKREDEERRKRVVPVMTPGRDGVIHFYQDVLKF